MKKILFALLAIFCLNSCKTDKKDSEETAQMKKVIAIHDEVMPKMGRLSNLAGELKARIDSTEQNGEYAEALNELQEAHESMMTWMKGFGERFEADEIAMEKKLTPQKKVWLDEEEEKVMAMQEKVNSSIAKAEALLNE